MSQSERGKISGREVLARYATALGGRLHHAIYFDDGDITAFADQRERPNGLIFRPCPSSVRRNTVLHIGC